MFDVIFTNLVANVNSFQCDAPQEIWLPGFSGTGGVNETQAEPGDHVGYPTPSRANERGRGLQARDATPTRFPLCHAH